MNWIDPIRTETGGGGALVNAVMSMRGSIKCGEFRD